MREAVKELVMSTKIQDMQQHDVKILEGDLINLKAT